jgi:hypothetical protein
MHLAPFRSLHEVSTHSGEDQSAAKKVAGSLARTRIAKVLSAYQADEKGVYYLVTYWLDLGLAYSRPLSRQVAANKR